jgi:hypothetical protein
MLPGSKLTLMFATISAALALAPASALGQGGASAASSTSVPINESTFAKYLKATSNYVAYMKQHPGEANKEDAGDASISEAAKAVCEPRPGVQKAVAAAGLTCVQWMIMTAELVMTGNAAEMVKSGQKLASSDAVSPADIKFYNAHTAEIQRALQEISVANGSE